MGRDCFNTVNISLKLTPLVGQKSHTWWEGVHIFTRAVYRGDRAGLADRDDGGYGGGDNIYLVAHRNLYKLDEKNALKTTWCVYMYILIYIIHICIYI